MIKIILVICIIILVSVIILVEYTYKNAIMAERKTEEIAIEVLKNRNLYNSELENLLEKSNYEEIECLSKEGYKLKGYYYEKYKNGDKGVILVHGYTANHIIHSPFVKLFLDEGFNVLLIDMRSHGNSEGKYVSYGMHEKEDLSIWHEILKSKLKEGAFIGLHGQSMGAATCLMYGAYKENVDFIVADCGYSDGKELMKYQIHEKSKAPFNIIYYLLNKKLKRKCNFSFDEISPIKDIKDLNIPIFFVHGTLDTKVPFRMSREMYDSRKKSFDKFLEVKDAEHMVCLAKETDSYKTMLHNFLEEAEDLKKH